MKIGVNVGGYHNIGTGHTYRQITMMEENPNFEYIFYINKNQDLAQKILTEKLITFKIFKNQDDFFKILMKDDIEIIINDILDTDSIYIEKLKSLGLFVVNFEDRGSGINLADIVINDMYDINFNLPNIYTSYHYTCMRRDLKIYKPLKFNNNPKNLIITFGGSDPQNFTKQVLDLLIENKLHNKLKIIVILGLGYLFDEIFDYTKYNVIILKNVINMASLLQKADIGITANGRTLFEFAHFNVPCISLAQNDREKIHTFAKEENGVIFMGEKDNFTNEDLLKNKNNLINNNFYRRQLSENMIKVNKILENSNQNIWNLILNKYRLKKMDVILQCRMNSTRLPKKALKIIQNKPLIEHVINRLKRCKNIDKIILCTSINEENDILEYIANKLNINCFRGSEDNVLERFYKCAVKYQSKNIIRCTGDCPLIDATLIDMLVENFNNNQYEHLNFRNKDITRNNNFPDGFDAEIFTFKVLEDAYKNDDTDFGKEHVTPYIVKKYGKNYFQIPNVEKYDLDNFHYSVDTEDDFNKVEKIYNALYPKNEEFNLYDILEYVTNNKYIKVNTCPLCNSCDIIKYSEIDENICLMKCHKCNLIFNNKIVNEECFYKQFQNYNAERIENIKLLSSHENRKKQYKLDYNFLNENIDLKNKKILDFGCGTGEFLDLFESAEKYGIEIDLTFNEILKKKGICKVNFIKEYYDIIIFRGTFQYIRNLNEIIDAVKEYLNEDGYLIFLQIPNRNSPVFNLLKDNWSLCNKQEFLHYWSIDILKKIFINFTEIAYQYPYKETPYYSSDDINKLIKSYNVQIKLPFAFYDNMFNLILKKNTQQKYLNILPNSYDITNISFMDDKFNYDNIKTIEEMHKLYFRMINNASGDWKWISNNKININTLFEKNDFKHIQILYSNFARNFLSFGIISNGIYEELIKNDNKMYQLKQNILNDIDTCIEMCNIKNIKVLDSVKIGNFYGIIKDNIFITPDNIRHYYSAYKINNFLSKDKNPTIMEIGGGYGGLLVNLLKSREDKFCYINIDIKNTLLVFYYYNKNYIEIEKLNKKIYFSEDGIVTNEIMDDNDIVLIPSDKHQYINGNIDLVFNSHSLSEMSKEHMEGYFETIHKLNIKHIFHINSIYFPWKTSDRGHIQISTKEFPINKEMYNKIYQCISPWMAGSGRYREYYYILK